MAKPPNYMTTKLPAREEMDPQYQWKLEHIYPTEEEWEADLKKGQDLIQTLQSYVGTLSEGPSKLIGALEVKDELYRLLGKIYSYARMKRDENNSNTKYQAMTDRATTLSIQAGQGEAFFVPELLNLKEDDLKRFLQEEPKLELYKFYLEELYRQKAHILSKEEEEILAQVGEISQASGNVFSMLNNADLKFPKILDEEGKEVEITHGRFIQFMESNDRRVRKAAFDGVYGTYNGLRNTLGATLSSSIKKDVFYARVRKYPSALEASLFDDNVKVEVYDKLIETVRNNLAGMHRYVSLRKRALDLDELHMYDLYTPIVKEVEWKVPYNDAKQLVLDSIKPLGAEYVDVVKEAFQSNWIDVYENQGKTSGAYAWGSYDSHPYILLNYQDNLNNAFTLTHEIGHAMHSYYSNKTQPHIYAGYTIFVAEVASTVNEALLTEYLLKTTKDKNKRIYLLNYYLERFRGTLFRQTMFAEFEKITHEKAEKGEPLTPEDLSVIYYQLNKDYYGTDIVIDKEIEMEWARIPHFYRAFYVYKYATGFSAATALAKGIQEEGQPAVNRYLEFLKSGSSDYPLNLLKKAGVDMTTPEPIEAALKVFDQVVTELEELLS